MLDWIFEAIATWLASVVTQAMDTVSGVFLSALGTDMTAMESYFPFVKEAFSVLQYTSWALLFLIVVWQLFKTFGGAITDAENPWHLVVRGAIFALLIAYSKPIFMLVLQIARAPYTALMDATMDPGAFTFAGIEAVLTNGLTTLIGAITIVGSILIIVMMISLGWNYFKLLLECVERYVVVGVLCYTSPLAYCMGGSKSTVNVFKGWCRMVGSQLLLLVLNVWFLRAFNSSVGQYVANGGALANGQGNIFLWLFCALAFLKTAQKFDSYLAAMGLNVAQTGSSMGMELLMAARVLSGASSGAARSAGSMFGGTGSAAATSAAGGFMAGFASKFKPNSFVRDSVVEGGQRMGAGGGLGFVGRMFGGVAARNGATLNSESIASVAMQNPAVSGTIASDIANRSLGNYMPHLQGMNASGTEITGGKISTTVTGADGKSTDVSLFSANQFEKPGSPYSIVTAADGSQWYQMASGDGAAGFYAGPSFTGSGDAAEMAQAAASFPGIADGTTLRTIGATEDGVMEANHPDTGTSMWYNSGMYQEPDGPHDTVHSADGVGWYAMQPHNDIPQFEAPGEPGQAFNQAQFQEFMPGYDQHAVQIDTTHSCDGVLDVRHVDGTAMRFYDQGQYQSPRGDYTVYEDRNGGQWYAVPGTPSIERRPVYDNAGKPIYDGDQIRTVNVESVRYKTSLTRFAEPKQRNLNESKPPKRK